MKKFLTAIAISAVALGGSACATKKMVKQRVGDVNDKVDTLSKSVEENQERTRGQRGRRSARSTSSAQAASQRQAATARADERIRRGRQGQRPRRRDRSGVEAAGLRSRPQRRPGRLQVRPVQAARLTRRQQIDELVAQLKANPNGAYIEIEGHTDSVGSKAANYKIGLDRAEAVKRYLYEAHQIPLHKINVISYGEDKPIAPNKTKAGRAQNRRVVIKVLA